MAAAPPRCRRLGCSASRPAAARARGTRWSRPRRCPPAAAAARRRSCSERSRDAPQQQPWRGQSPSERGSLSSPGTGTDPPSQAVQGWRGIFQGLWLMFWGLGSMNPVLMQEAAYDGAQLCRPLRACRCQCDSIDKVLRFRGNTGRLRAPGEAEVGDLDAPVLLAVAHHQNVAGLQVPARMHAPLAIRVPSLGTEGRRRHSRDRGSAHLCMIQLEWRWCSPYTHREHTCDSC